MAERPAFRYVNELVGSLVLLVGLLLVVLVVQVGRVHDWFRPGQRLRILLPEEGSFGLTAGAEVRVLGTKAGEVVSIGIVPPARMQAGIDIRREFLPLIRRDSTVTIRKRFGVAGDAYLTIAKGSGAPLTGARPTLQARAEKAPMETLQLVVEALRNEIIPVMGDMRTGIQTLTALSQNLLALDGEVAQIVRHLRTVTARLEGGEGSLGKLLADETLAVTLHQAVSNVEGTTRRLGPIVSEIRKASTDVSATARNLRRQSHDLPGVTKQIHATFQQFQVLLRDVAATTEPLPATTQSIAEASVHLPALMLQLRETLRDMEILLERLQSSWLLGGARRTSVGNGRMAPNEALP